MHIGKYTTIENFRIKCENSAGKIEIILSNVPTCIGILCDRRVIEDDVYEENLGNQFDKNLTGKCIPFPYTMNS